VQTCHELLLDHAALPFTWRLRSSVLLAMVSLVAACSAESPRPCEEVGCSGGYLCLQSTCTGIAVELPSLTVAEGVAWAREQANVSVRVSGSQPDTLELFVAPVGTGGVQRFQLDPSLANLGLDLRSAPEGVYQLMALGNWSGVRYYSAPVLLGVDRTPPSMVWTPGPGTVDLSDVTTIEGVADEPFSPLARPTDVLVTGQGSTPLPGYTVEVDTLRGRVRINFSSSLGSATAIQVAANLRDAAGNRANDVRYVATPLVVALAPLAPVHTNGTVNYTVGVTGGIADQVTLSICGVPRALAPSQGRSPYQLTVDTRGLPESNDLGCEVHAEVIRGGESFFSARSTLFVDRTRPSLYGCRQWYAPNIDARVDDPIILTFDDIVDPASVGLGLTLRGSISGQLVKSVEFDASGHQLTVRVPVAPPEHVDVLFSGVMDLAGNPAVLNTALLSMCSFDYRRWQTPGYDGYSPFKNLPPGDHLLGLVMGGPGLEPDGSAPTTVLTSAFSGLVLSGPRTVGWTRANPDLVSGDLSFREGAIAAAGPGLDDVLIATVRVTTVGSVAHAFAYRSSTLTELGTGLNLDVGQVASAPSIASGTGAMPVVAWIEPTTSTGIPSLNIRRWDGTAWSSLGGAASALNVDPAMAASQPQVRLDGAGNPVVTWVEQDAPGTASVKARRWDGSAWTAPLGGGLGGVVGDHAMVLGADGQPVVGWTEVVGGRNAVHVSRFDGLNWLEMGPAVVAGASEGSSQPWLAIDSNGAVYLATVDGPSVDGLVRVRKLVSGDWLLLEGAVNDEVGVAISRPMVAIEPGGRPVVSWEQSNGLRYRRYNR